MEANNTKLIYLFVFLVDLTIVAKKKYLLLKPQLIEWEREI